MSLPPGVIIQGQRFRVVDWKSYMSMPAAKKQITALKELRDKIKEQNSV